MAQIATLARGLGVRAENMFIGMARAGFLLLDEFKWDPDPDKTKIFIAAEGSDIELDRLPQVRVSVGDISELEGALNNGLVSNAIGAPQYRFVDQAYVMFSVYAGNSVEARDLGDYLKNLLFHARSDLGRHGIFGLRNLGSAQPKAMERGATTDRVNLSIVTAGFYMGRTVTVTEEDGPMWNRVVSRTTDKPTEITLVSEDGFEAVAPLKVSHSMRSPRVLEITFDAPVGPFRPGGFTVSDDLGAVPLVAQRGKIKHDVVELQLQRDLVGTATTTYSGTGLYDYFEEALVETFTFDL